VYKPKANNGIVKAATRTHITAAAIKPKRILRLWRRNLYRNKRWKCIKYENEKYIDLETSCSGSVVLEFICLGNSSQAC
jgi:hypothetical protein